LPERRRDHPLGMSIAPGLWRRRGKIRAMLSLSRWLAVFAFAFAGAVAFASAEDFARNDLRIDHPYLRPTPPGARTGAAYFTVRNVGRTADRLLGASTPAAKAVELHTMTMDGNVMRMRAVKAIDIPAGGEVALATHGYHAMLVDLAKPLKEGERVPLTLRFEHGGQMDIVADVEGAGGQ
jgi:copper(I)-binding protein